MRTRPSASKPLDEPPPTAPADIGAQHRRQREAAEKATIRALDTDQIGAWLDRALDSQRREVAIKAFRQIRADADKLMVMAALWGGLSDIQRSRFFAETIRPWLDAMEREDASERG